MLDVLRSTLKNTFIYSIGTFSSRLAGFILIPLYTSHFSVDEYGALGIMEISAQMLLSMMGFSLYNAFFRWYWDKDYINKQKSILFTILVFLVFQLGLFLILGLSFQQELSQLLFDSAQSSYLIKLLLLVCGFETIGVLISTLLRLKEKAVLYTFLQVGKLAIGLFITIFLITSRNKNIEAVYEAQLIANIIYLILILNLLRKNIVIRFEWKILRDMLSFSLPLVLTSVSGIIFNITDRFTLRFLSGMADVGVYNLGFKVANTIRVFVIASVNLALQPMIFKMMNDPDNKRFYSKIMTYFTYGLMFFVLFFALFAPEIVKVISRQNMQYWDAYKIIPLLSFSMLFSMLRDVAYTGLNITKKTRIIAMLIILAALFNIMLNYLFIPKWDFYGAAMATTISQIVFFISVYAFAQKYYPVPYEIRKIILMVLTGTAICLSGLIFNHWSLLLRFIIKIPLILSFPFILYLFGFYEPVELERLGQFWRKWYNPLNWRENFRKIKLI
ncbi:MAG: polysaccharide biosynthesis C-terminal domain-containing protein [Bacteroidales bacterium]|nr:polysaccharide biosynthesis C-terminal domain-containing protein [Bacteroidales bacterium]